MVPRGVSYVMIAVEPCLYIFDTKRGQCIGLGFINDMYAQIIKSVTYVGQTRDVY